MSTSETVAKILLSIKAVSFNPKNPYKYSSGILSPVYTDCRILMSYPEQRKQIRDLYIQAINEVGKFDLIAATATAGIPHAAWIADKLNLPMVYVRGASKDHGKGNQVEGLIKKGQKAVVIEDLISTGESSAKTANAVRKSGADVEYVFSIMTYGIKKAEENFNQNNLKLVSLTNFADVVKEAETSGYINKEDVQTILDWTKDPTSWKI